MNKTIGFFIFLGSLFSLGTTLTTAWYLGNEVLTKALGGTIWYALYFLNMGVLLLIVILSLVILFHRSKKPSTPPKETPPTV